MKSLVWRGPEEMAVEERPEPEASHGSVVIRVGAAGICGSEVEGYLGRMGNRAPPLVMGHEFSGTVVETGERVPEGWTGKRVTVNPLLSCDECRMCRLGMENLCPKRALIGIQRPGGFAEYVAVPESTLTEVPEGVDSCSAALAEPLANGAHVARLGLSGGMVEDALVIGGGTIGLMCLQALRLSGVPRTDPGPRHVGLDQRGLDEVVGDVPVAAAGVRHAAQVRAAGLHERGERGVALGVRAAHRSAVRAA